MQFIASPHHGRRVKRITAVVIHYTGSLQLSSTVDWFTRPESKVSAHYVIGREGEVVQMVQEDRVAWHAGVSQMPDTKERNVNAFSIGVELVGTADSGFPAMQFLALVNLVEGVVRRHNIPLDRVVGHKDISPGRKIDPDGNAHQFPWGLLRRMLRRRLVGEES